VTLPAADDDNHLFFVVNASDTYSLIMPAGFEPISPGANALFAPDGDGWHVVGGASSGGWSRAPGTWSYSSADSPNFVASINVDATGFLQPGTRIKLTQTTDKYFIVVAVGAFSGGATLVTLYGGTDYTLTNAAIVSPQFSNIKAPFGFPLSPNKWTVIVTDTTTRIKTSPTQNVWYSAMDGGNLLTITLPIGVWRVSYKAQLRTAAASSFTQGRLTLSTANNAESDTDFTTAYNLQDNAGAVVQTGNFIMMSYPKTLEISTKTVYYLIVATASTGISSFQVQGAASTTIIKAVCEYL
jgi:hypothetical protein